MIALLVIVSVVGAAALGWLVWLFDNVIFSDEDRR